MAYWRCFATRLVYRNAGALPASAFEDLVSQVEALDMDEVRRQVAEQQAQEGSLGDDPFEDDAE